MKVASFGKYGVDLFFVLSGWLIGGLYWQEELEFGNVNLRQFWSRRWLRTIPPYLVALVLSWLAVLQARREPFDWGYLLFLQNYYERIPFFLVSWSLCIEEHFYLILPLLLAVFVRGRVTALFLTLILTAIIGRLALSVSGGEPTEFGFALTATHLRLEGLLLGFLLARWKTCQLLEWRYALVWSPWILAASLLSLVVLNYAGSLWTFRYGFTVCAVGFSSWLVLLQGPRGSRVTQSRLIKGIALSSYSVYLTHPLMIHLARLILQKFPKISWFLYFPLVGVLISAAGFLFYVAVEKTSIQLRDRIVPRRRESM